MAPGDYKVQASIGEKYKPLIICGGPLHEQTNILDFVEKRRNCDQNIDLWLDGSLYPIDPRSGKRPRINSPSSLLEFVGDGENGLLGYLRVSKAIHLDQCRKKLRATCFVLALMS